MKLDVLVFAAHPDDAELCCGGTIAKLSSLGKKVGIIDITKGELSSRGTLKTRRRETLKSNKVLNIFIRENLFLPDGEISNTPLNRNKVICLIRHYKPEIIFLPYPKDRHPDHEHTSQLIRESAFYSGLIKIKTSFNTKAQKPFRPKRNIYYMQTSVFEPSFIIDISDSFRTKMKAVRCYSTQFYTSLKSKAKLKQPRTFISDKKFLEYVEARAKFYGFQIGAEYGEPFYIEGTMKLDINNIFGL